MKKREEILASEEFKKECDKYGLYNVDAEAFNNVILVRTPVEGLYIFLDNNYKTIGVEKIDPTFETLFANTYYEKISSCNETSQLNNFLDYPFENYSLYDLFSLADKYESIKPSESFNVFKEKEDGSIIKRKIKPIYDLLISYIKFINEEIRTFYIMSYRMQVMGFSSPSIYEYIRSIMESINLYIEECERNQKNPQVSDILTILGKKNNDSEEMIEDIIKLLKIHGEDLTFMADNLKFIPYLEDEFLFSDTLENKNSTLDLNSVKLTLAR